MRAEEGRTPSVAVFLGVSCASSQLLWSVVWIQTLHLCSQTVKRREGRDRFFCWPVQLALTSNVPQRHFTASARLFREAAHCSQASSLWSDSRFEFYFRTIASLWSDSRFEFYFHTTGKASSLWSDSRFEFYFHTPGREGIEPLIGQSIRVLFPHTGQGRHRAFDRTVDSSFISTRLDTTRI